MFHMRVSNRLVAASIFVYEHNGNNLKFYIDIYCMRICRYLGRCNDSILYSTAVVGYWTVMLTYCVWI